MCLPLLDGGWGRSSLIIEYLGSVLFGCESGRHEHLSVGITGDGWPSLKRQRKLGAAGAGDISPVAYATHLTLRFKVCHPSLPMTQIM